MITTKEILIKAKGAAAEALTLTTELKNNALLSMASALEENSELIIAENRLDLEAAKGTVSEVMLDRLMLNSSRISAMAKGIRDVAALPDPVGETLSEFERENGLKIRKVSVPMGVVAIIYESRPNVTSDAAALALKSGNVCVLRGGKEAFRSSYAIVKALKQGLEFTGLNPDMVNILEDTTRAGANELMTAVGFVDLLIPRGGAGLINACIQNATVPCIQTGTGICHIYVDKSADLQMALNIIENAKMSRPSVCNAAEVCLIHEAIAGEFLPMLKARLQKAELRVSKAAAEFISGTPAKGTDFDTEFLDYILAVDVVADVKAAVAHISAHSTHHSEAIIASDPDTIQLFTASVDSSSVYVNASTRFTDGGEFGLGCEMGISTQKLHARGPMGLKELTAYKYIITGNGQIR